MQTKKNFEISENVQTKQKKVNILVSFNTIELLKKNYYRLITIKN